METRGLNNDDPLGRLVEVFEVLLDSRTQTPWMTLKQTAAYLQVSERQVRLAKERGELPYSRQGRDPIFHRDRVDEWLLSQPTQRRQSTCRSRK